MQGSQDLGEEVFLNWIRNAKLGSHLREWSQARELLQLACRVALRAARKLSPLPLFTESRQETCDLEGTHDSARDLVSLGLWSLEQSPIYLLGEGQGE